MSEFVDPRAAFIDVSVWHGTLDAPQAILAAHPEIASSDVYTAALLGDDAAVRRFLALDPAYATSKGGPRGWDALTYLCFSKFLRLERERTAGFVRSAKALLDAGASANTGFWEANHQPKPEWESALYGAAGVAHHAEITRLLLERGADPNDEETPYHTPESYDNAALEVLVESGKLTADSQATMLLRKADWHDYNGMKLLLEAGVDPNRMTRWGYTALDQALRRDNAIDNIELVLDHGGKPSSAAISIATRRGRGDVLSMFEERGFKVTVYGVERLIAACARHDDDEVRTIAGAEAGVVRQVRAAGGRLLAEFAGNANTRGVELLLGLGVPVEALYEEGDGYYEIAPNSTALHVAAWRARHATVKFLIEHGARVNALDGRGRTPLELAVRACVDSYWAARRSPESVKALLDAGAPADSVEIPTGYAEVDELLKSKRK